MSVRVREVKAGVFCKFTYKMGNKGQEISWKHDQDGVISRSGRRHSPDADTGGAGAAGNVDKRDFDVNRPLLSRGEGSGARSTRLSSSGDDSEGEDEGRGTGRGSLLSDVVNEIRERDRRKVRMNVVRICSFIWGVLSWFVSTYPLCFYCSGGVFGLM